MTIPDHGVEEWWISRSWFPFGPPALLRRGEDIWHLAPRRDDPKESLQFAEQAIRGNLHVLATHLNLDLSRLRVTLTQIVRVTLTQVDFAGVTDDDVDEGIEDDDVDEEIEDATVTKDNGTITVEIVCYSDKPYCAYIHSLARGLRRAWQIEYDFEPGVAGMSYAEDIEAYLEKATAICKEHWPSPRDETSRGLVRSPRDFGYFDALGEMIKRNGLKYQQRMCWEFIKIAPISVLIWLGSVALLFMLATFIDLSLSWNGVLIVGVVAIFPAIWFFDNMKRRAEEHWKRHIWQLGLF